MEKKPIEGIFGFILLLLVSPIFLGIAAIVVLAIFCILILSPFFAVSNYINEKRFFKKNHDKIAFCISGGNRMLGLVQFHPIFLEEFDEIVVGGNWSQFPKPEHLEWLVRADHELGFPQIIYINEKPTTIEFREDYLEYGRKRISKNEFYERLKKKIKQAKE